LLEYDFGARIAAEPSLHGDPQDINTYLSSGNTFISKINSIFLWAAHRNGNLIGYEFHLTVNHFYMANSSLSLSSCQVILPHSEDASCRII
jgi:hypothetical protein